jgi:hypothetical protein
VRHRPATPARRRLAHGDPSGRFAEFNRGIRSSGGPRGTLAKAPLPPAAAGSPGPRIFGMAASNGGSPVHVPRNPCSEPSLRNFTPNFQCRLHSHLILYCSAFRLVRPILRRRRPARLSIQASTVESDGPIEPGMHRREGRRDRGMQQGPSVASEGLNWKSEPK